MNEAGKALAIVTTVEPMALDMLPPEDGAIIATSLRHEDEAALESGIASVFDSLRSARATDDRAAKDNTEDGNEDEEIGVEPTFVLLAELNRIWAQPLAA